MVFICPPASAPRLDPSWPVPHPGFGITELSRNGRSVWFCIDGDEVSTVGQLTEWCPVRQGVGWALEVNGPMKREVYRLRNGEWVLTERGMGFA